MVILIDEVVQSGVPCEEHYSIPQDTSVNLSYHTLVKGMEVLPVICYFVSGLFFRPLSYNIIPSCPGNWKIKLG